MIPKIWGGSGWDFLHFITLGYPENPTTQDMERYRQYFEDLKYVLPCNKCKNNMNLHLKKLPLTDEVLSSRESLVRWGIDLHNLVNESTGKPILTYDEAMDQIEAKIYKKESKNNFWFYLLILIAVIIIIYLFYLCLRKK